MKKFIISIFIIILSLWIVDILYGISIKQFLRRVSGPTDTLIPHYTLNHVDADLIIIGGSRARNHYVSSILQDSLNLKSYNCGKGGALFYYQICMIDGILQRYTPKVIIWDIEPLALSSKSEEYEISTHLDQLAPYCGYTSLIDSIILSKKGYMETIKLKSSLYRYNSYFSIFLSYIIKPNSKAKAGYVGINNSGYIYPTKNIGKVDYSLDNDRVNLFKNIINMCKENDIELILSFSPCYSSSNYKESNSYKEIKKTTIEEKIKLIDFYHENQFMQDSTLFKDNIHINERGATLFTQQFCKELNKL